MDRWRAWLCETHPEAELRAWGPPLQDPPLDDKHCICPTYYPDFFR